MVKRDVSIVVLSVLMIPWLLGLGSTLCPGIGHAQDPAYAYAKNIDWEEVLEENAGKESVESRLLRGIACANLGRLPQALEELEIADEEKYQEEIARFILEKLRQLRHSPEDVLLLNCAAFGSYAFGDLEQSAIYFEDIITLNPNNVWARDFCALVYGQNGDIDRAHFHLERSLELDPKNQYTHLLLSAVYKEKQQYLMAVYHYLQAPQAVSELRQYGAY